MLDFYQKLAERDEAATARSLPLTALAEFCAGKDVVIAGTFAQALAPLLPRARVVGIFIPGSLAEVASAPRDLQGGPRCIDPSALAICLPACDILVVSDASWGEAIVSNAGHLSTLANKVRDRIVLPFEGSPLFAACRWVSGHSWVESSDANVWIWANSERSQIEAEICLLRQSGDALALKFHTMTRPGATGDLIIDMGGQCMSAAAPSEWITVPFTAAAPRISISWRTDISALVLSADARRMSFGLVDMHLVAEDGTVVVPPADFMQQSTPDITTARAARSALHAAGFTRVHSLAGSSDGNRRDRFIASSSIMLEGLDCIADDHGAAAPMLLGKGEMAWLFASKSLTACPLRDDVHG
ncbi:hypothetical protein [Sphingobium chungbukense]|uniref:Uncharacterized protein n=1 Tax=Sphingobium chungbukense TaxID=56193 RepID=A0A0M3AV80_9SPHN|nr:hypothetical protein [Sphingobium chungbukense]KKW94092.1 hypothetical protein YP76_05685 [Sphingobium chungbukense]